MIDVDAVHDTDENPGECRGDSKWRGLDITLPEVVAARLSLDNHFYLERRARLTK